MNKEVATVLFVDTYDFFSLFVTLKDNYYPSQRMMLGLPNGL